MIDFEAEGRQLFMAQGFGLRFQSRFGVWGFAPKAGLNVPCCIVRVSIPKP